MTAPGWPGSARVAGERRDAQTTSPGGYRDPESQAFIESWFSKLKERLVWRSEFETLDQAREAVAAYVGRYHRRPHSQLNYRTPLEVRGT